MRKQIIHLLEPINTVSFARDKTTDIL